MKAKLLTYVLIGGIASLGAGDLGAQEGNPEVGQALFQAKMCNLCHTLAGESGPMANLGGSLDAVGQRRDAAWLRVYFTDPKAVIPTATMPPAELSATELQDMIAYLLSLR